MTIWNDSNYYRFNSCNCISDNTINKRKEKPILALKLVKFYEISSAFIANELYMNCTFKNLESKKKNW